MASPTFPQPNIGAPAVPFVAPTQAELSDCSRRMLDDESAFDLVYRAQAQLNDAFKDAGFFVLQKSPPKVIPASGVHPEMHALTAFCAAIDPTSQVQYIGRTVLTSVATTGSLGVRLLHAQVARDDEDVPGELPFFGKPLCSGNLATWDLVRTRPSIERALGKIRASLVASTAVLDEADSRHLVASLAEAVRP